MLQLWEVPSFSHIRDYKGFNGAIFAIAVSPDGGLIAAGGSYWLDAPRRRSRGNAADNDTYNRCICGDWMQPSA